MFKNKTLIRIEKEENRLLDELALLSPTDERYQQINKELERLNGLKEQPRKLSWDTLAIIGGNVVIAVLVLAFESQGAITTKVSSYLMKGRV